MKSSGRWVEPVANYHDYSVVATFSLIIASRSAGNSRTFRGAGGEQARASELKGSTFIHNGVVSSAFARAHKSRAFTDSHAWPLIGDGRCPVIAQNCPWWPPKHWFSTHLIIEWAWQFYFWHARLSALVKNSVEIGCLAWRLVSACATR